MHFALSTRELGSGIVAVEVAGEVDLYSAPELGRALDAAIDRGSRRLLVDLSGTTFIDSTALGVLIGALKRLRPYGGELAIACLEQSVRTVFELTHLDRSLPLFATCAEAQDYLRASAAPEK
jgi:anti-sigma B factor antagonist